MVMGVLDKSFDVLVLKLGVVKRVYCEVRQQLISCIGLNLSDIQCL